MNTAENKQLIQRIFTEVSNGKPQPFIDSLADDCQWTVIGTTDWSKTYDGKQAVLTELLGRLFPLFGKPLNLSAHRFIAEDDFVVIEARGENNITTAGVPYNNTYCFVLRLADGKVRELTEYLDTALVERALPS